METDPKASSIARFTDLLSFIFKVRLRGMLKVHTLYHPSGPLKGRLNLPNFSASRCPVGPGSLLMLRPHLLTRTPVLILRQPLASALSLGHRKHFPPPGPLHILFAPLLLPPSLRPLLGCPFQKVLSGSPTTCFSFFPPIFYGFSCLFITCH